MSEGRARADRVAGGARGAFSGGRLERALRQGRFVVTAELAPPDSADPYDVYEAACPLAAFADGVNATDSSGANCHMSPLGVCSLLTLAGYEVIYQISCRDRNRIAVQGDVLSAAAIGVKNVLCLTGDSVGAGDHPEARPVFDLDCLSLLRTIRTMCDEGRFLSGRKISAPPRLFVGATENPCAPPHDWRPDVLRKKIAAGAQFIQTNFVFDLSLFARYMDRVRDLGLDQSAFILVGIGPLASAAAARWLQSHVPGIQIPEPLIRRLERSAKPADEGKRICVELIEQIAEIPGVSGIHLMAHKREHLLSEIVGESRIISRQRRKRICDEIPRNPVQRHFE